LISEFTTGQYYCNVCQEFTSYKFNVMIENNIILSQEQTDLPDFCPHCLGENGEFKLNKK